MKSNQVTLKNLAVVIRDSRYILTAKHSSSYKHSDFQKQSLRRAKGNCVGVFCFVFLCTEQKLHACKLEFNFVRGIGK